MSLLINLRGPRVDYESRCWVPKVSVAYQVHGFNIILGVHGVLETLGSA